MTLGIAAAAGVRLIVWCKKCQHLVELDLAEMAARYGEDTSTPDWRERARLFRRARSIGCDHQAGDLRRLLHLWQIDPAPQVRLPESRRNPGKFQTAV